MRYFLLIFVIWSTTLCGQLRIKSQGTLPKQFYSKINKSIPDSIKTKDQKYFWQRNNLWVSSFMMSGKVLCGDSISEYVNKVGNKIVEKNNIKETPYFFVVRSPYLNAFVVEKGYVFINIGAIARLDNEAELAFILCHELAHYINHDNMNTFIHEMELMDEDRINIHDKLIEKHSFSKNCETVADSLGYVLFRNCNYDPNDIKGVFDKLRYSDLPIPNSIYNKHKDSFLDTYNGEAVSVDSLKMKQIVQTEIDLKYSTHPAVEKREESILEMIQKEQNKQTYNSIQEIDFERIKTKCLQELPVLYLAENKYIKALFSSNYLQLEYPESSAYYQTISIKSLINLCYLGETGFLSSELGNSMSYEIFAYQDYFKSLSKTDLTNKTLQYVFNIHLGDNKNLDIESLLQRILNFASENNHITAESPYFQFETNISTSSSIQNYRKTILLNPYIVYYRNNRRYPIDYQHSLTDIIKFQKKMEYCDEKEKYTFLFSSYNTSMKASTLDDVYILSTLVTNLAYIDSRKLIPAYDNEIKQISKRLQSRKMEFPVLESGSTVTSYGGGEVKTISVDLFDYTIVGKQISYPYKISLRHLIGYICYGIIVEN